MFRLRQHAVIKKFFLLTGLIFLQQACSSHSPKQIKPPQSMAKFNYQLHPSTLPLASKFGLQGLSALVFQKEDRDRLFFWTLTDRGPNLEPTKIDGHVARPFLEPSFTPKIFLFSVAKEGGDTKVEKVVELKDQMGHPLHGLPPVDRCNREEIPVDADGKTLSCETLGIDSESLAVDGNGNFWVGDEYGPSLFQFSPEGKLIKRYVPWMREQEQLAAKPSIKGLKRLEYSILPEMLTTRDPNKGFEGLALSGNYLYAILQSPLPAGKLNPFPNHIPIIKIDTTRNEVVQTYWYPVDLGKASRIGDMSVIGEGQLLILEQNSKVGPSSVHKVFKVSLVQESKESLSREETQLKKVLLFDLVSAGYDSFEKVEGLSVVGDSKLAVVNDNDFGVYLQEGARPMTMLSIFELKNDTQSQKGRY